MNVAPGGTSTCCFYLPIICLIPTAASCVAVPSPSLSSRQPFDLLLYLLQNCDRVASKGDLDRFNLGRPDCVGFAPRVASRARETRLATAAETQKLIRTIARKGFRFVGAVSIQEDVAEPAFGKPPYIHEQSSPALSPPDRPTIAVLPFVNMSGDPEQAYFSDGISEDIITALSKLRWFFVIARNSSFIYKGRPVHMKQVAEELGVGYLIEGSVRRDGNRVRITAQLSDAAVGTQIWAEPYDRDLVDVFAVQDEITEAIVAAIEPQLYAAENFRANRKPPDSMDAWSFVNHRHSSSASCFTAGASGFLNFNQSGERPDRQRDPSCLETARHRRVCRLHNTDQKSNCAASTTGQTARLNFGQQSSGGRERAEWPPRQTRTEWSSGSFCAPPFWGMAMFTPI